MAVFGEDESERIFLRPEMNMREDSLNYGHLSVFIRHDSVEIWGFRYEIILGLGTPKIIASTL
jgi:hypothetical protein